jgi:hypothetical protein
MHMSLTRSKADYLGPIVSNTVARQDNSRAEEIGLDWFPQRSVALTTSVQKARRSTNSDYAAYEYDDKSVNFFLQLTF